MEVFIISHDKARIFSDTCDFLIYFTWILTCTLILIHISDIKSCFGRTPNVRIWWDFIKIPCILYLTGVVVKLKKSFTEEIQQQKISTLNYQSV